MYYMIYRILYYISFTASEMYKITSPEFFFIFYPYEHSALPFFHLCVQQLPSVIIYSAKVK